MRLLYHIFHHSIILLNRVTHLNFRYHIWTLQCNNSKIITIILKLSPPIGVTTSTFVWRLGILTLPTLMMMAVCFLTPNYTSSEKRLLISDHIKGPPVAVFRSPLMKVPDRSVATLGLWIVTALVSFIKSVNQSSIKPCLISFKVFYLGIFVRKTLVFNYMPEIKVLDVYHLLQYYSKNWENNILGSAVHNSLIQIVKCSLFKENFLFSKCTWCANYTLSDLSAS